MGAYGESLERRDGHAGVSRLRNEPEGITRRNRYPNGIRSYGIARDTCGTGDRYDDVYRARKSSTSARGRTKRENSYVIASRVPGYEARNNETIELPIGDGCG